jgi:hypothetical protein
MRVILFLYFIIFLLLGVFSYGFQDPHIVLTSSAVVNSFIQPLIHMVYQERTVSTIFFCSLLIFAFIGYIVLLKNYEKFSPKTLLFTILCIGILLIFSYPAFTHDLFNYMTTAKVTFTYHENPYLVMPIEIPNEPYLAFTRGANKVALYGPVWIALTAIPHWLGGGKIWQTIIMFKLMNVLWYFAFLYLIYRATKSIKNVLFFALNPLILIETLISGHNDIYMMVLACSGLYMWQQQKLKSKLSAATTLFASILVKGATVVLLPLLVVKNLSWNTVFRCAYLLLSIVLFVFAPLREELYPWYAVWIICIASFMDMKKNWFIISFTVVLSFSLELRHLPYMWMGYYEGPGPMLRLFVTVVPIILYFLYLAWAKRKA